MYASAETKAMMEIKNPGSALVQRLSMPVDSPMVLRNSRHSITEAGLDTIVENLRRSESNKPATIKPRTREC